MLIALLLIALFRIAHTYGIFNQTVDESAHVAAGMEWLDAGTYTYADEHPPMRAVYAIGLRAMGLHHYGEANIQNEGRRILYGGGHYWRNLTAARLAALPFFSLTVILVFVWAREVGGALAAVMATLAYTTLPLALAHAGLATTDTLVTATIALALFTWARWLSRITLWRAIQCGAAIGLAILSKFSAILFLGVVLSVTGCMWLFRMRGVAQSTTSFVGVRRLGVIAAAAAVASVVCLFTLWAGYRFSVAPIDDPAKQSYATVDKIVGSSGSAHDLVYRFIRMPVPAPELFRELRAVKAHSEKGHTAIFMGEISDRGHVLFFPVALLIKTPIPFLVLMLAGAIILARRGLRQDQPMALLPPLAAGLILLACMPSTINIGLRHLLPIFPLLAICAGVAAAELARLPFRSKAPHPMLRFASLGLLVVLLTWQSAVGARAHPDYLAYFNECCAAAPQNWLNDSDLDWGQDLARLSDTVRTLAIQDLHVTYFGSADITQHGLPHFALLRPYEHASGWIAASEYRLALGTTDPPYDHYRWLLDYEPVAHVGKSIRLYRIP